ncbi:MAG: hypothetical protein KDA53_11910 [Hyphomonas sp.]|nr:hypothetical protein [Hyphomonas sp.]
MKTAIFTICSRNYLAYALTLRKSVEAAEPDCEFFIYLADEAPEPGTAPVPNIVPVTEMGLPNLMDMAFRYTVMEFNTAIKADCLLDLLARRGFEAAIFLDPDIRLFAPLAEVHAALENGASMVLTPHIRQPLPEGSYPDESEFLKGGVFNLGFGAFAATPESLAFIRWWAGRLHADCYSAPERGLFVDQRFVDLAPCFVENLSILRHPGYNVAYWNIANRDVTRTGEDIFVNGAPLVFFHFSGVQPGHPEVFSKHLGGRPAEPGEAVRELVSDYLAALEAEGHDGWSRVPYAFGHFRDGSPILPPMRRAPPAGVQPEDWFAAPDTAWWNTPAPGVDCNKGAVVTRLMAAFHALRPDLQAAFPLSSEAGRRGLGSWFRRHGAKEYGIPGAFLEPARSGSARLPARQVMSGIRHIRQRTGAGKGGQPDNS